MMNSKIGSIIKNEVERSIKNKWFVILNIILLLTTVIGLNFNNFKSVIKSDELSSDNIMKIYVEDKSKIAFDSLKKAFEDINDVEFETKDFIDEFKADEIEENVLLLKVEKSDTEYVKATLISKNAINAEYVDKIEATLTSIKDKMIASNKNLTADEIKAIKEDATMNRVILSQNSDVDEFTPVIQLVSTYLIFFVLLLCLSKIANTISQEKMSKSTEYILTSITTKEYIISKVLSMCLIVVIQFVFVLAYSVIAVMISSLFVSVNIISGAEFESIDLKSVVSLKAIGYVFMIFVFMCLTTFLQGVIQCVMSAKTTNIQEAGNATVLLVTINFVLYTVVTAIVSPVTNPSFIAYILSVIPLASMYFIPSMMIVGQANLLQVIISLIILGACVPLSLILAEKPFKNAILDYSAKKNKKINGIEKIIATREYQDRMITRKESSKKGLIVGLAVILLIILQVIGGLLTSLIQSSLSQNITFISTENIYLILTCFTFVISLYVPYLVLKLYLPKEEKKDKNEEKDEETEKLEKEERKKSLIKCLKYIVVSVPIISIIQMICAFTVEKIGITSDVIDSMGFFNYGGKLSTLLIFILIAILPAIFEELFIRKGVYGVLKSKGTILATVASALVFATIHLNISQFIFAFLVGILFAIVREKTGKLYPTMILHFFNNAMAIVEVLFYEHTMFMQVFTYVQIGVNAVGFCILIYMLYKKFMELKDKESIQRLKEALDYRKIKLNIVENMYVFKDYTFMVAAILCAVMFTVIERIL